MKLIPIFPQIKMKEENVIIFIILVVMMIIGKEIYMIIG